MKKLLVLALIGLAAYIYFTSGWAAFLTLDALKADHVLLQQEVALHPYRSALIYVATYMLFTAINLPGAIFFTLAGGALFGLIWGTILVSLSASVGSTVAFLIARYLLRQPIQKRYGHKLKRVNKGIEEEGAYYLFTIRLVPILPFYLINIVMALTPIKAITFLWVSFVGMLFGTLVYVYAGTQLASLDKFSDIISLQVIVSFSLLGLLPLFIKRFSQWLRRERTQQN